MITPTGIDCSAEGTSSTSGGTPGTTIPAPPLRYLATTEHPEDGLCWFWSPYPPGLDSWDPANDMDDPVDPLGPARVPRTPPRPP